jgi:hypothetical protein
MLGYCLTFLFALMTADPAGELPVDVVEPPVVGQPANFSGAIGSYRVTMRAEPTELQAEDPLLLTVRLTGSGDLERLQRPDLRTLPRFTEQFQIETLQDRYLPNEKAREFDYHLRPRSISVKEIPALPFVYFKPGILPAYKGYQTTYAASIPLVVKPRAEVTPSEVQGGVEPTLPPDPVLQVVQGPRVLGHEEPFSLPGPVALAVFLLAPPLLCSLWFALWRQRYPDAARQARQRRSRAARQALHALRQAGTSPTDADGRWAANIVATYLRRRLELGGAEPTPSEIRLHLKQMGIGDALGEEVAEFFRGCDAARFARLPLQEERIGAAAASRLIVALEADPWLSRSA